MNPYSYSQKVDLGDGDFALDRQGMDVTDISTCRFVHTVLPGETIQSIAFKYYGDSGRWADIADVNSIYDVWTDLEEGMNLYIP